MFVVVIFDALSQANDFRIGRRQVVLLYLMQISNLGCLRHQVARRLNAHSQTDWARKDQAKTRTRQPAPIMSERSAPPPPPPPPPLTSLPVGPRTLLWRSRCNIKCKFGHDVSKFIYLLLIAKTFPLIRHHFAKWPTTSGDISWHI